MSLFKRKTSRLGQPVTRRDCWSYKFEWRKQQIKRDTMFRDRVDAQRAMRNHRLGLEREWNERGTTAATDEHYRRRTAQAATTIAEILAAFVDQRAPLESKLTTRLACANALRNAFRRVHGPDIDPEALSVSAINPSLVERYFADATVRANTAGDQARTASIKRTAGSVLRQAMAVFSPAAQRFYRSRGLQLPDLDAVRKAVRECRFTRVARHEYVAAPQTVVDATLAAWETIDDRDIFLAIGHALSYGLRKSEIAQARWSWHVEQNGQPFLATTAGKFKDGAGRLTIRALDPFYSTMMKRITEKGWRGADADYIITGTDYYRTWEVFNRVAAWLRALGWHTQKACHALREYSASQVALMDGIWTASTWLRHKNVTVTQTHYCGFVSQFALSNRHLLKVKWAG